MKLISKKDFNKLIESGIIRKGHQWGNVSEHSEWSSGYVDSAIFKNQKEEDPFNKVTSTYSKMQAAHVGISITKTKIYIQDKYLKYL